MATKTELAVMLKDIGLSHLEIARELYPEDYKRYRETGDRYLYNLLKKRVWKLLKLGVPKQSGEVDSPQRWIPSEELEFDYGGGERDPLSHREQLDVYSPVNRKLGKKGVERQIIEYEQYLRQIYNRVVKQHDPSGVIWGTARLIHQRGFREYYTEYKTNVWNGRGKKAKSPARTYAYTVLMVSGLIHGMLFLRPKLERELEPDREHVSRILPIVLGKVI